MVQPRFEFRGIVRARGMTQRRNSQGPLPARQILAFWNGVMIAGGRLWEESLDGGFFFFFGMRGSVNFVGR